MMAVIPPVRTRLQNKLTTGDPNQIGPEGRQFNAVIRLLVVDPHRVFVKG